MEEHQDSIVKEDFEDHIQKYLPSFSNYVEDLLDANSRKDFALESVKRNPVLINNLHNKYLSDKSFMLSLIELYDIAFYFATDELKQDRQFVLDCMKNNGLCYTYMDEKFKTDIEIAKAAVKSRGRNIDFVPQTLLHDEDFKRECLDYLQKQVAVGDARAMNSLGSLYYYGKLVEKDEKKAYEMYKMSADLNFPLGLRSLGYVTSSGSGIIRNFGLGMEYVLKAAKLGDNESLCSCGNRYLLGEGVVEDFDKGLAYYKQAAYQLSSVAIGIYIQLCLPFNNKMDEVIKFKTLAAKWENTNSYTAYENQRMYNTSQYLSK